MKKTLIIAGLISAAGLATAAPAAADPVSIVSCSPAPLCTVDGQAKEFQSSVTDFVTKGPVTFVNSVGDFATKGPVTFVNSVSDFATKGPTTFVNSVSDLVTNGPKTFSDSITNPGGTG